MRIVIVGAGQVGASIAAELAPSHEIIVVDTDEDRTEELEYELDILTVRGDGASVATLDEAEISRADVVIASTNDDQVNLIVCELATVGADPFTIARVKDAKYLRAWEEGQSVFGIDLMICSTLMTAQDIVRVIEVPSAIDINPFADGHVEMIEFEVAEQSAITNQRVAEADRFEDVTFVGLFRDDETILPRGDTQIVPGDRLVVVGPPDTVRSFVTGTASDSTAESDEIVIVGGSQIGAQVAQAFEARGKQPTLVEHDRNRARELAEDLPNTLVIEQDVTEEDFAQGAPLEAADVVISALETDEQNLLISMLAKRHGTARVVSVVDDQAYLTLFEEVGIDVAVNPRAVTAEEIIRATHRRSAENIAILDNQAEVMEFELEESNQLVGQSIEEIVDMFDVPLVFGAVVRDGEILVPRGDTVLNAGDRVIAFITAIAADEVAAQI